MSTKIKLFTNAVMLTAITLAVVVLPGKTDAAFLSFQQIDWGDDSGGFNAQDSDWGRAEILFDSGDDVGLLHAAGGDQIGWVNIAVKNINNGGSSQNWAVRNVPIFLKSGDTFDGSLAEGFTFDLGVSVGTNVTTLDADITIDATPIASFVGSGFSNVGVTPVNHVYGGFDDSVSDPLITGGTGQNAPPPAKNTIGATATDDAVEDSAKINVKESTIAAIDEEHNGCAPGSAARSIHYLAASNPGLATDLGTETPQDTYEALRDRMMTDVGEDGEGTLISKFKTGKDKYNEEVLDSVTHKIATEQSGGTNMDFMDAMDDLKNGADIEAMIYWGKDGDGKSMGGHAAFISEIIKIKDKDGNTTGYKVNIIDDRTQGDSTASNSKTTLIFDKDGNLSGYGDMARMIGFQTEMYMMVPEPPTYALLGFCLLAIAARRRAVRC